MPTTVQLPYPSRKQVSLEVALYGLRHDEHLTDLIHNERFKAVFYAVVPNPEPKYRVIAMRYAKRQTYKVIGKCLRLHESNARIYIKHALRTLAQKVKEHEMVEIIKTPILKRII